MKVTIDDLVKLRIAAQKQADAYARMVELGGGVGLLGVEHPEMFDAMIAWDDLTENDFADIVLELVYELIDSYYEDLEWREANERI